MPPHGRLEGSKQHQQNIWMLTGIKVNYYYLIRTFRCLRCLLYLIPMITNRTHNSKPANVVMTVIVTWPRTEKGRLLLSLRYILYFFT